MKHTRKDLKANKTTSWEKMKENVQPILNTIKEHPWKSHYSLKEMIEKQTERRNINNE